MNTEQTNPEQPEDSDVGFDSPGAAAGGSGSRSFAGIDDASILTDYLESLDWGPGQRDQAAWNASLRAGSLAMPAEAALKLIAECIKANGGTVAVVKLKSQLGRAYAFVGAKANVAGATIVSTPKVAFSAEKLLALASKVSGITPEWLKKHSPVNPVELGSREFLEHLYHGGEKVIVFTDFQSQGQHLYEVGGEAPADLPEGASEGVWFLVNPVDGDSYPNPRQMNKPSRRSEESVVAWRYLVLENDVAEANAWLSCLVQLPLRIAAIYTSGGKSIHALVRLDAVSKQHWDEERNSIKPIMVPLGADPNAMTAVRLSRLPATLRGERLQELLYLDPSPDGKPIIHRALNR